MGLAFTEMTTNQKEQLNAWLRELNGETPKEPAASAAIASDVQEVRVPELGVGAKSGGLRAALQELVSLLGKKGCSAKRKWNSCGTRSANESAGPREFAAPAALPGIENLARLSARPCVAPCGGIFLVSAPALLYKRVGTARSGKFCFAGARI